MISNILIGLSLVYLLFGSLGINKLKGLFPKLLTSSMIDTTALILLVVGLILRLGFSGMALKLFIALLFILLTNPVINHIITKAAYEDLEG